jgi:hypothetical protein
MSLADARLGLLAAEIARDWAAVVEHAARAERAAPSANESDAAFVALSLHHAYEAFESILLRTERTLGLPDRSGTDWHAKLLDDATLEIAGARPAIVPGEAKQHWLYVLRFRHFLRRAYVITLDPAQLVGVRVRLHIAVKATRSAIEAFLAELAAR